MALTREDEDRLIRDYDPMLRKIAARYYHMIRRRTGRVEYEDIYQSARLGFLEYIRLDNFDIKKCGNSPYITHRMFECVRNNGLVYIPKDEFSEMINMFSEVDSEDLIEMSDNQSVEDQVALSCFVDQWAETLDPPTRSIVCELRSGSTWGELTRRGLLRSHSHAHKKRRRLRHNYQRYLSELAM